MLIPIQFCELKWFPKHRCTQLIDISSYIGYRAGERWSDKQVCRLYFDSEVYPITSETMRELSQRGDTAAFAMLKSYIRMPHQAMDLQ